MTTPMVAIWAVGLARAGFEEALKYARVREQGGKAARRTLFRSGEAFRHVYQGGSSPAVSPVRLCLQLDRSPRRKRVPEYGYAAKNFATQTALEVTSDAIQILGSNGLTPEYLTEKLFRDARMTTICDGSNDVLAISGGWTVAQTYPRKAR